jgi:hypothetical protein
MSYHPDCWLAKWGRMRDGSVTPPCSGALVQAHLVKRQLLTREGHADLIPDRRVWVPACGGLQGNAGHHGMLDAGHRPLVIPRIHLPAAFEHLMTALELSWWVDREYGPCVAVAASVPSGPDGRGSE